MRTQDVVGKRIVGVIWAKMSSNNRIVDCHEGLVLEDARGRRSYLRWATIEETDGAYYGTELIYPGARPRNEVEVIRPKPRAPKRPDGRAVNGARVLQAVRIEPAEVP